MFGNILLIPYSRVVAPIRRASAAAGYVYTLNEPGSSQDDAVKIEVEHLRDSMDDLIADNFSPQFMKAIAVPKIRRAYADTILLIRDAEEEAVFQIENLLKRCGKL